MSEREVVARARNWIAARETDRQTVGVGINLEGAAIMADLLRALREAEPAVSVNTLHRYLADAHRRGADHQRDDEMPIGYEHRVMESEAWAREFIALRQENGVIPAARSQPETPASGSTAQADGDDGADWPVPLNTAEFGGPTEGGSR